MNRLQVINPRTGQADCEIPGHDSAYVAARAVELREAQSDWQALGLERRCAVLQRWRDAIERHSEAIVEALCIDTGRYLMARFETASTIHRIDHWIARAPEILGRSSS